jgi:hypothetical protein
MISEPKLRRTEIRKVQSIDNTTGYVVFMNDTFDGLPEPMIAIFPTEALAQEFAALAHSVWDMGPTDVRSSDVLVEFCQLHAILVTTLAEMACDSVKLRKESH